MVAAAETHVVGEFIDIDSAVPVAEIALPPDCEDGNVENNGEDEIEKHTATHHQESLPGRMTAEFPVLGFPLQGFRVH